MSDYPMGVSYRRVFTTSGVMQDYKFATSAFSPGISSIMIADPAKILATATARPGWKREPIGNALLQYRLNRELDESHQCPVVLPSIFVGFRPNETRVVYDAPLLAQAIERGITEIPMSFVGDSEVADAYAESIGAILTGKTEDDVNLSAEQFTPEALSNSQYTTSMSREEIINSITSRIRLYQSGSKAEMDEKSFAYVQGFLKCNDVLDAFIASGNRFADVDHYENGNSLHLSMMEHIEYAASVKDHEAVEPMDMVDRFAWLYELKTMRDTDAAASYMKYIDVTGEQEGQSMARFVSQAIFSDPETLKLASTQLSENAKTYLSSFAGASGYKPVPGPENNMS